MRDEVVFAHICFEELYRFGAACGEKVKSENGGGRSCEVEKDEDDPGSQAGKFTCQKPSANWADTAICTLVRHTYF
jgi:hypothetical protein